jgi:hypothetical protein
MFKCDCCSKENNKISILIIKPDFLHFIFDRGGNFKLIMNKFISAVI